MDTQTANRICRETELLAFVQVLRAFRMDQSRFLSKMTVLPLLARLLRIDEAYSLRAMTAVQEDRETAEVASAFRESSRRHMEADASPSTFLRPFRASSPSAAGSSAGSAASGRPDRGKADRSDKTDKSEKSDRGDRGEKGDKGDKGDKTDKTDKADKADKTDKSGRNPRGGKAGKADKAEAPADEPRLPAEVPGWNRLDAAIMARVARDLGLKESAGLRFIRIAFSKHPSQRGKRSDLMVARLRDLRRDLLTECSRMINQFRE